MIIRERLGVPELSDQGASLPERQRGVPAAVPELPAERCMPLKKQPAHSRVFKHASLLDVPDV